MHTTKECVMSNTNNSKVAGVCSECTTARATRALLKELLKRKLQMCYMPLKFISWISTVHFLCASPYKRRIIILGCLKFTREIRGHFLVTWDLIFVCTVSWAASINVACGKVTAICCSFLGFAMRILAEVAITWLMCAHWRNDRFYPAFRLLVRQLNMWSITEQTHYVCSRFRGKIDPVSFVQRTRKYFSLASYRLTVRTSCSVLGIFSEVFSGRYKGKCTGS